MEGFACWETSWGWMAAAAGRRGLLCLVLPCASAEEARRQAQAAVKEPLVGNSPLLQALAVASRDYLAGREAGLSRFPLDWRVATPFQRRVLEATRLIPRGETRTYGQVAAQAGSPGGARAVGQALGANPWPLLVPCHRVVAAGGPGGFSGGGLAVKRSLLALEGVHIT